VCLNRLRRFPIVTAYFSMVGEEDFDPYQYTTPLMWSHILQKGFQAGSLVGTAAVGPVLAYRAGNWQLILTTAGRAGLIGVALSSALRPTCIVGHESTFTSSPALLRSVRA
jgi:hypothetical protein